MSTSKFILIIILCSLSLGLRGQKIEYYFGDKSDVTDSIKYVIEWYKKNYKIKSLQEVNLFVGIDYCDGGINLFVSQYSNKATYIFNLIKRTNRFVVIDKTLSLPIVLSTDILVKEIGDELEFINMNGYYLRIEKNDHRIWKVVKMNITF